MNHLPDFSTYGYEIERELGSNRAGGRVTYLATALQNQSRVVIKQFQFVKTHSSWSEYDAYQREIEVMQGLDHPGIPCYLDSFQTEDGFCMVQDYKQAQSLRTTRSFSQAEIRQIAIALLEILVYLQHRMPSIIHRDIKPDNILVDEQINVYLVDFGFARVGDGEVGVSSVVKGTLGFMPPEQLFNRQLTEASDLYGLGMTLICLLTGTKSDDIGNLVDISYRVNFKQLLPKLNVHWVNWLEKMVEPRLKDRYTNAMTALAAMPTAPIQLPEVRLSQSVVELRARQSGDRLSQLITVSNLASETDLVGSWEVAPHLSDPPHTPDFHPWISVHPAQFSGNWVECEIAIDTRPLMTGKTYQRQLLLHTNAAAKTYTLDLHLQTAPIPIRNRSLPYGLLALITIFSTVLSWILTWITLVVGTVTTSPAAAAFGLALGIAVGFELAAWMLTIARLKVGMSVVLKIGMIIGLGTVLGALSGVPNVGNLILGVLIAGLVGGTISGLTTGIGIETLVSRSLARPLAIWSVLLTQAWGVSLGSGLGIGFFHPLTTAIAIFTSLALSALVAYMPMRTLRLTTAQHRSERNLIKP